MNPHYPDVARRANERCEYCRAPGQVFNFTFEVEHIMPRAAGGSDSLENLALSCDSCNRHKSDTTLRHDRIAGREVPLFHPRRDVWAEHFAYDDETGEVTALTATGRVTLLCLQINSAFQIRARRQWIRLGLYP